jgi:hypothetical protein
LIDPRCCTRQAWIFTRGALWHFPDDLHGFHAARTDPQQQVDHLFLVIGKAVGVEFLRNGRVLGFFCLCRWVLGTYAKSKFGLILLQSSSQTPVCQAAHGLLEEIKI